MEEKQQVFVTTRVIDFRADFSAKQPQSNTRTPKSFIHSSLCQHFVLLLDSMKINDDRKRLLCSEERADNPQVEKSYVFHIVSNVVPSALQTKLLYILALAHTYEVVPLPSLSPHDQEALSLQHMLLARGATLWPLNFPPLLDPIGTHAGTSMIPEPDADDVEKPPV